MKTTLITLFVMISILTAGEYHIDKDRNNMVKFVSDASIEHL